MLARASVQERSPLGATRSGRGRGPTPAEAVIRLQRAAGNAAVAGLLGRRRLARTPNRAPVTAPGQGYDGILELYGQGNAPRTTLTTAQKEAVSAFRSWMEGTFSSTSGYDKSNWAREAGGRAAAFQGGAAARAQVYAEMQRQIIQATGGAASSWKAFLERGADGSYVFRGNPMPPGGGLQRVFVINPQGECFVGEVTALEGRGPGKTVRYDLLRRIGPPAPGGSGAPTGGAVKPPAVEPARGPKVEKPGAPKVEPKGGQAPKVEGPGPKVSTGGPAAPKVTMPGWLKGGTMLGVQVLVFWWLGQKAEKALKRRMAELMDTKVNPAVAAALKTKAGEAELLTARHPEFTVYANVTMELDESWTESGIGGAHSDHAIDDARFIRLEISTKKPQSEKRTRHEKSSGFSQITNHESTKLITYSFEVDFGETKEQHRWRMFRKQAGEAAQRGLAARDVAGRQHFDPELTHADRREEERRRKWGLRPLREELQTAERILWVYAYIDYTFWADLDKLWADAIKYLKELEEYDRREAKRYGMPTRAEVEKERQLRDYLSKI